MERMADECDGAYAVPTECSAPIYYDDVETYAAETDGADLPGTVAYVTVNDDLTDYVASLSGAGADGETVSCSVSGSDRRVTCEPL
jgi:hypothetical protein